MWTQVWMTNNQFFRLHFLRVWFPYVARTLDMPNAIQQLTTLVESFLHSFDFQIWFVGGRDEWRGWWSESTRVRISHDVSFYAKFIMIVRKRRGLYYIAFVRKRFSTLEWRETKMMEVIMFRKRNGIRRILYEFTYNNSNYFFKNTFSYFLNFIWTGSLNFVFSSRIFLN